MKRFTPLFIACFIAFPLLHSCLSGNFKEIKGNYTIVNEKIAIDDYEGIILGVPAEVIYQQISQAEPFLQVLVDENILPRLKISVEDHCLVISQNTDSMLRPTQFKIYTNSRSLCKVEIAGTGNILMEKEVNSQDMDILISGVGNVKTDSLYCEILKVKITGAGDAEINGAATNATFSIDGTGSIKAFGYLVQDLNCSINGAGDVEAYVSKNLNANVSGVGNLRYKGNPETVVTNINGVGDIRKTNE
ncbi:MAG: DUF2807 domain-containing protein [Candidatus Symbiothrix sp.]|jgi:hypothetical protein|nr:DUF2807 domain-containing protein [Candidatus Symbiothrix sp.]